MATIIWYMWEILFINSLHNQTLENVQSAKYHGITISDNMD